MVTWPLPIIVALAVTFVAVFTLYVVLAVRLTRTTTTKEQA